MVVDLISTVQPTGGGSPRNEWLLIDSDDAIGGKSPQHQGIVFDSQTRGDPEKHGYMWQWVVSHPRKLRTKPKKLKSDSNPALPFPSTVRNSAPSIFSTP